MPVSWDEELVLTDPRRSGPSPAGAARPDEQATRRRGPHRLAAVLAAVLCLSVAGVVTVRASTAPDWLLATNLPAAQHGLAAVTGSDGRFYAFGGAHVDPDPANPGYFVLDYNYATAYSPASDTWDTGIARMNGMHDLAAVAAGSDGRIYVIGGRSPACNCLTTRSEAYTPAPGTPGSWSDIAAIPTPVWQAGAATGSDGRIYVVGGSNSNAGGGPVKSVEVYDPRSDTWASGPPLHTARANEGVVADRQGRIYAIGGGDTGSVVGTVERLTPGSDGWVTVASMITPRSYVATVLGRDGRIYAIGGAGGPGGNEVEAYDSNADSWSAAPSLTCMSQRVAAAAAENGNIYAFGPTSQGCGTSPAETMNEYLAVAPPVIDHLVLSPSAPSVPAGSGQSFTARAFDASGDDIGDVTSQTTFTVTPDGVCTGQTCTAVTAGAHTVTGTDGMATGTAALTVTGGAIDRLRLSPPTASVGPGASQAYRAQGFDAYGNDLGDVTAATSFGIAPDGSCTGQICVATTPGAHTVTGSTGSATATATLRVAAPPDTIPPMTTATNTGPN